MVDVPEAAIEAGAIPLCDGFDGPHARVLARAVLAAALEDGAVVSAKDALVAVGGEMGRTQKQTLRAIAAEAALTEAREDAARLSKELSVALTWGTESGPQRGAITVALAAHDALLARDADHGIDEDGYCSACDARSLLAREQEKP